MGGLLVGGGIPGKIKLIVVVQFYFCNSGVNQRSSLHIHTDCFIQKIC